MVIPPEERFSVQEKNIGSGSLPLPKSPQQPSGISYSRIPRRKNASAGFSAFFPALFLSDVFFPAMTVYKDRRLPAASPGNRSPISVFKPRQIIPVRLRPQKTDCREKATAPHEAERCTGLPRRKSVLPAPVFPSFSNKKSPAFGEPPGTFKERENQLVVFCMK